MNPDKYSCPNCQKNRLRNNSTYWECLSCGHQYSCINGIPRLYVESELGAKDKELRDTFYNGFLGTYYQHVMPFLSLPVRPAKAYWKGWLVYVFIVFSLLSIIAYLTSFLLLHRWGVPSVTQLVTLLVFGAVCLFFNKHPYILYVILLTIPVRISLRFRRFQPSKSFATIHTEVLEEFLARGERLQVLDISTGTCNSLYRHGWMKLNADFTALDLSERMLLQGQRLMTEKKIPVEFVLGDAARLPFEGETFDIVLNYGAMNGFTNPKLALEEMARITKKGGLVLFLDEQLYEEATFVERFYFKQVLSSHNVIHRCPVELIPASLGEISVHQVYHFYYICTCRKK